MKEKVQTYHHENQYLANDLFKGENVSAYRPIVSYLFGAAMPGVKTYANMKGTES